MESFKIDISVLLIFFVREEQVKLVFEQIREARPSRLFLYQDGPRKGVDSDVVNISRCRDIVESVDWECEVHRMYQDENIGCDPSGFISHKWMFEIVDRGIILEDDVVPSQSFFPFCAELLERYKDDTRVNLICGMNNIDYADAPTDYIFTRYGATWGWATWRRNMARHEANYDLLGDSYTMENLKLKYHKLNSSVWRRHSRSGVAYFESILEIFQYSNSMYNIVPTKNMISNIGLGVETTHAVEALHLLPRRVRSLFYKKKHEIYSPLKHPKYVVEDMKFNLKFEQKMYPSAIITFLARVEGRIYRMFPFLGKL